jgi:hypothetical protein
VAARKEYPAEQVDLALACFAAEWGRRKHVTTLLKAQGLSMRFTTVRSWAYDTHNARYLQIKSDVEEAQRARLAESFGRLATEGTALAEDALGRLRELLERRDRELKEIGERIVDVEDRLAELNAAIDVDQRRVAVKLEIPDADALIEEILGDPGDVDLDRITVARLNAAYRRRSDALAEQKALWNRRDEIELGVKDLAKVLHESSLTAGNSSEKLSLLTGGATGRVEHSFPELQRALEAKGIRLQVGQGGAPSKLPVVDVPELEVANG